MIQKVITSLLVVVLLLSYPLYVAYTKVNGGIFLALVIMLTSILNITGTSWLTLNNHFKKQTLNVNAGVFFMILALSVAICLLLNFSKGVEWLYYVNLLVNIMCAVLLFFQLRKYFFKT